ncbi:MAG: hypothetical protein GY903_28015, partial [Fuerstiella sp.]|nr:hypothetical protein [Fuerstiella sp.]
MSRRQRVDVPSSRSINRINSARLLVEGRYSTGAERLACLAAASWSYHISSDRLDE